MLSVILPSYNEEPNIIRTTKTLSTILDAANIDFELVFINDGSKDHTWNEIANQCASENRIVGINFSRNFGKEAAITAGLKNASGDCCVVMDCDLQHPPETIIEMYRLWTEGYEVVEGVKKDRGKESKLHAAFSRLFYKMMTAAVGIDMSRASDFKLLDRKVVDSILSIEEHNSFFRALSTWVGYKSTSVEFEVRERIAGKSKWSTKALIRYALQNIAAFSAAPLLLVAWGGIVMLLIAVILGLQTMLKYLSGSAVEGFTTVILLILIVGSLLMIGLGIIGFYLSKIYEEVKGRPKYLITQLIKNSQE